MKPRLLLALAVLLPLCLTAGPGLAQKDKKYTEDEDAITERAKAFAATFDKGDAKAVAAFWTADGDYTDQTGKQHKGRAQIQKAFSAVFAENKGLKLGIDSAALRFVTPEVAIEDGVTEVLPPDGGPPSRARFTIVHVKKDGKWFLGSVRDAAFSPPTNYEHLRELEWLVGDWSDESEKGVESAHASFAWGRNQNFLLGSHAATFKNITLAGGSQTIGYDPISKKLRSWNFESDGGFGEGSWAKDGKSWTIKTTAVHRDGKKATATNVLTRVDADTLTWQSKDRTLDGKEMPDIKPVRMKRKK